MVRVGILIVLYIGWATATVAQESAERAYNRLQRAAARIEPDELRVSWSEVPARKFASEWTPSAKIDEAQLATMLKDGQRQRAADGRAAAIIGSWQSPLTTPKDRRQFLTALKAESTYWPTMPLPLKVGNAGVLRGSQPWTFRAPLVVDVIDTGNVVVKMDGQFILIRGLSTAGATDGGLFACAGPMIVVETKLVGNKTMFVLEPLWLNESLLAKAKKLAKVK